MPKNKNTPITNRDEPSPFVEDRVGTTAPHKGGSLITKPWIWLVALAIAGLIIFSLAQKPASTPTRPSPAEPEAVAE
ncbi:MAG: hypothetical protein ACFB16_01580 [Phormidesmis sp.]